MILNIIQDFRRPEKLGPLEQEMLRQGISYRLWDAIILPDVVASINASHKAIVRYAKETGLPEVAIAEDDVCFPAPDGWLYWLERMPLDFDIYAAGTYGGVENFAPKSNVGAHCYIVHERYYDRFLAVPDHAHIDLAQDGADIEVVYPMAAIQRPGWSANNQKWSDYNSVLSDKDVYGGIPSFTKNT